MRSFTSFLTEEVEGEKLKHITHAEDRPLQHGAKGFTHAYNAMQQVHDHIKSGGNSSALTMKYDGSPAVVFGRHPENGKFFVASKSAFNKNPKLNYTHDDIVKNHGHAPGLVEKLHSALNHLKKIAPKTGVYQGDLMYSEGDKTDTKKGVSFTPNTITYTAKDEQADKIRKSKLGVIVHTQYHGNNIQTMGADPHPDLHNFTQHPDVWHKSANHDTKHIHYSEEDQNEFSKNFSKAKEYLGSIYDHDDLVGRHTEHLQTYINKTVREGTRPTTAGYLSHLKPRLQKEVDKLSRPENKLKKSIAMTNMLDHVQRNKKDFDSLFKAHTHLDKAKNVLLKTLENSDQNQQHTINGKDTKPEGFVVGYKDGSVSKVVNRSKEGFSGQNLNK